MNPYLIVDEFEKTIADYAGSEYGVAVESCSAAIFLSCLYEKVKEVTIPKFTYPSVPCSIIHSGGSVLFDESPWEGVYYLRPTRIIDAALRFHKNMYVFDTLYCLSFHAKKQLPIGRGGMILTDDKDAYEWFKRARFDGRGQCPMNQDKINTLGWNMYLTPEQAALGLMLFDLIKDKDLPDLKVEEQGYPDLSLIPAYTREY